MFFGRIGLKESWFGFMATHPPLLDRIERLDPLAAQSLAARLEAGEAESLPSSGPAGPASLAGFSSGTGAALELSPRQVVDQVGRLDGAHLNAGVARLAAIPPELGAAVHNPLGALAVLYGLLLDRDAEVRNRQWGLLTQRLSAHELSELHRVMPSIDSLGPLLRLPLADLMLPALRRLSEAQLQKARAVMAVLIEADGRVDVFEFTLQRLFQRRLAPASFRALASQSGGRRLWDYLPDMELCLSVLAGEGHSDPLLAAMSWRQAVSGLRGSSSAQGQPLTPQLHDLDAALTRLAGASLAIREQFLSAAVTCVLNDGKLVAEESELLRLFALSLELPLPPLVEATEA